MENTVTEPMETNSVDKESSELQSHNENEVGVTEEVNSEATKEKTSEKEISWESIAAEIAADAEESRLKETEIETKVVEETVLQKENESAAEETIVKNTVINIVTEEKSVTSEVSADSAEKSSDLAVSTSEKSTEVTEEYATPLDENESSKEIINEDEIISETAVTENNEDTNENKIKETPVVEDTQTSESSVEETVIEISELKPEETPEAGETIDEIEYTVLEAEESTTSEIIEEHITQDPTSTETISETVVIINPDQTQTEITIQQVEDSDRSEENSQSFTEEIYLMKEHEEAVDDPKEHEREAKPSKPRKPRGRKPIADIPLHVLGRDISKPTEGVSNGGRTMPKPRLGVKVPYRNLTSQIVSKAEIEKEIMERFKIKQEQNTSNSGDILFARKLTQRLAKKLIPSDKDKVTAKPQETTQEPSSSIQEAKSSSEIQNNSDLIAILEGEGDDIELTKQKQTKENDVKDDPKKLEKEIALEQLKELPGKNKIFKSKNEEEKKVATPVKEASKVKTAQPSSPQKITVEKKSQVDVEPRLKTGVVIKTYTRKRRSTESEPVLPPKKAVVATTNIKTEDGLPSDNYITKSSRVIKRKVIWDPADDPAKSPIKTLKIESPVKAPPAKVEKKEADKSPEKKTPSPVKKVITKSPPSKKPKRLTEVDKLLMDEGAINMLYDVKTNDDSSPDKKKKTNKSVISLDKAHKELLSKTNVIKNDLQQNTNKEVQKSLRKKEIVSPTIKKDTKKEITPSAVARKKSKDSTKSSPPASPPYNAAEASRIIRRHSSSSFSSNDEMDEENAEEKTSKKKTASAAESKKKPKKVETKPPKEIAKNNNNTVNEVKVNHAEKEKSEEQHKSFSVTKKNKLAAIKLLSTEGQCYLDEQVLKELTSCLNDLSKDDDCHVVSITSDSNESFCEGLDYSTITADDDDERKKKANDLASLVKEFLRCLLNFPKVLVAGIQGDCVGLGVTMLPLFDMVIASDTATFSAPYTKLGCIPEAGFLLTVPHLSSNGLASELLYTGQVIKADDAFRRGLVTRLCWPEKYQQELKTILSQVASQSVQSIIATKQVMRQHIIESTEVSLSSVNKVLVEYWTSPECQKNFSK